MLASHVLPSTCCSSREWRLEGQQSQKVLPHPSFVYCAQYHPAAPGLVLTGGFDTLLRLWRVDVPDVNGQLLQEEISESDLLSVPINKLQLHPNGRCLLIHARDSVLRMMDLRIEDGMAYVWNTDTADPPPPPSQETSWRCTRS
ncbi:hypothetical protein F7725_008780 [Dissostichus mawsoni]|uniref:Uncharacterized protein n=1 Tax=Dissostichus mawsoni TaxID=36200 RepID=A0A7J5YAN2_DISMA|nr:hypothetical protein F7725_008780 [Dissostichus mawsoni]